MLGIWPILVDKNDFFFDKKQTFKHYFFVCFNNKTVLHVVKNRAINRVQIKKNTFITAYAIKAD